MASVSRAAKALDDGVLWVGGTSGLALTFFEEELGPLPYPYPYPDPNPKPYPYPYPYP